MTVIFGIVLIGMRGETVVQMILLLTLSSLVLQLYTRDIRDHVSFITTKR